MQLNRGFISVRAVPGEGCVFTLKFRWPGDPDTGKRTRRERPKAQPDQRPMRR
jgi:hypothetical protein